MFVVTPTERDPWERPGGTTFHFVGTGIGLFDRVDPARIALDQTRTDASSRVTHLTYAVAMR
ncbi:hypothetical protein OG440_32490 [Streptomyces sp. NBC_00637]|uniref:hypothetical protein n=1 Tax=Streptomyces sp. NBC_00637 TaxID=2903667 RepID=UPI00324ED12D